VAPRVRALGLLTLALGAGEVDGEGADLAAQGGEVREDPANVVRADHAISAFGGANARAAASRSSTTGMTIPRARVAPVP